MAPPHSLDDEAALFLAYGNFLKEAKELASRFERMGLPVPDKLLVLRKPTSFDYTTSHVALPPMPSPPGEPHGFKRGWIWVPIEDKACQPKSLVLAVLRRERMPVSISRLIAELRALRETVSEGSIANLGTALQKAKTITRDDMGWFLLDESEAPQLSGEYLWGPKDVFTNTELAWFRRAAIKHVLKSTPDGMQAVQISKYLQDFDWLPATTQKDVVQDDLEFLRRERVVRRIGHSRKWELSQGDSQ
jgi:hypothetical protein